MFFSGFEPPSLRGLVVSEDVLFFFFESLQYHPDPRKMTAEFEISRSALERHVGHVRSALSEKDCNRSKRCPFRHEYS